MNLSFLKTRRRTLLIVTGCVLIGLLLIFLWPREREPYYKGKSLSQWLDQYGTNYSHDWVSSELREAGDALRHIGTNALPWLVKWIRYEPPAWKRKLLELDERNRFSRPLGSSFIFERLHRADQANAKRQQGIFDCFQSLGSSAAPAIPELYRIAAVSKSDRVCRSALSALANIGSDALPSLAGILTNQQANCRWDAAHWVGWLGHHGTDIRSVTPVLVQCVDDRDGDLAAKAAEVLGQLKLEPEITLPCLIHGLKSPSLAVRGVSATVLPNFMPDAKAAVPALTELLSDPFLGVRKAATNALLAISPESLTNAAPPSATDQK